METKLEDCENRVKFTLNYLDSVADSTEVYGVYCDTAEGIEKALTTIFNSSQT